MYTRSDTACLMDAAYRPIPGHFLLNNGLGVMRRSKVGAKSCLNSVISHMASVISDYPVPLLYPEALLFPRLFADGLAGCDTIIGCLPSFMYIEDGIKQVAPNLSSLQNHLHVRAADMFSNCARTPSYQHFIFDIQANRSLKHSSCSSIMRRGLNFIPELRNQRHLPSSKITYDEVTAELRLKEVSHMVKNAPWNFFMTLTCNDHGTPGVCSIYKSIENRYIEDKVKQGEIALSFMPIILSSWRRTVNVFIHYLTASNEHKLGRITAFFKRWEYQDCGAIGNKPHAHIGLTTEDYSNEQCATVITARMQDLLSLMFDTTEQALKDKGLIKNYQEFLDLDDVLPVQQHRCDTTGSRCQRTIEKTGKTVCRLPFHPFSDKSHFKNIEINYEDNVKEIFRKLNLLTVNKETKKEDFHPLFVSGRWLYRSEGNVTNVTVPTVPEVWAFFKSSSNVQVCDRRFAIAYMLKYITKPEKYNPKTFTGSKNMENIKEAQKSSPDTIVGDDKKSTSKSNKQSGASIREVSYSETIWNNLHYEYLSLIHI